MKRYFECTKSYAKKSDVDGFNADKSDADESDVDESDVDEFDCMNAEACRNSELEFDRMKFDSEMKFEFDCMHFETCKKTDFNCNCRKQCFIFAFDFCMNLNRSHSIENINQT